MTGRRRECFEMAFGIGTGRQNPLDNQEQAIPSPSYDRQGCVESSIFEVATPSRIPFKGRRPKLTWRRAAARHIICGIPVVPCVVCYVMVTLDVVTGRAVARCEARRTLSLPEKQACQSTRSCVYYAVWC